jgi:HAD superfamily hydrolase (TIGR01509 family)
MAPVIRALLFDFDGTLIDTESIDLRSWQEIFEQHGVELPEERFALRIGTLSGPDELDELDALLEEPADREAVTTARQARELELLALEPLRPGVERYIDDAHRLGLAIAIVSSSTERWIGENLDRIGFDGRWTAIVAANGDHERAKPAPTLYLDALHALDVDPHEAIAFEDSPNGVRAARDAGIFCVAVPNPVTARLDLSDADLVLESFEDLSLDELLARVG